jgi:16S rRNA (adenine1518-N6/adenine1519-N6)-dimethyltransferase
MHEVSVWLFAESSNDRYPARMREEYRLEAKKSLGQHFLNNAGIPKSMADAADVTKGDIILEVGPGTGVLTRELLARGATVVAIEADERAIEALTAIFSKEITSGTLRLHHADVRELHLSTLDPLIAPQSYKVVANIPYYLSGMLFRTFLETDTQPSDLVFLVQKEVAERIVRDPKESLLSLSVKVFGDPKYIKTVGRGNFTPPPKVDSSIIAVRSISKKRLSGIEEAFFFKVLHVGFGSKRKQLLGNLTKLYSREVLVKIFTNLSVREDVRGEDLPLATWIELIRSLSSHQTTP